MNTIVLFAQAVPEITTAVNNIGAGFTVIKALIEAVVFFGIVIGYVKFLRADGKNPRGDERGH